MSREPVVGRLAPSPTGELHLGHALAFLAAWWSARSQRGRLLLRHEDVDAERAKPEHITRVEEELAWLGIEWDGPGRLQSEGEGDLKALALGLADAGLAYPCTCSRADITQVQNEILGAPQQGQLERPYPGTCRGRYRSLSEAQRDALHGAALRLATEPGKVTFTDRAYGPQAYDVHEEVGDFHILRRNGSPAYQLAVTGDDYRDGVTEIVRGRDLLPSTARQILIARALGRPYPKVLHLPLVCDSEGRRLSKRHNDLSLRTLRESGITAKQIAHFAAAKLGQDSTEDPWTHLTRSFDGTRVPTEDILLPRDPFSVFA